MEPALSARQCAFLLTASDDEAIQELLALRSEYAGYMQADRFLRAQAWNAAPAQTTSVVDGDRALSASI